LSLNSSFFQDVHFARGLDETGKVAKYLHFRTFLTTTGVSDLIATSLCDVSFYVLKARRPAHTHVVMRRQDATTNI
jgi:hypothetical protein